MRKYVRLSCIVLGALAACANNPSGGSDMGTMGPEVCMRDNQTAMLAARYGVQANLVVNVKVVPGCSGQSCVVDADANAKLLLLAEVTQSGTSASVTATPCRIQVPPVALKGQPMPVRLTVPDPLIKSVKPVSASSALSSTMTCATFNSDPITLTLGANLANPTVDPLPPFVKMNGTKVCGGDVTTRCLTTTTPAPTETGCVCDQEADGKLGASVDAMNAPGVDDIDKIYVNLRTSVSLAGQVFPAASGQTQPGPRIKGKVANLKLDQNVLGCHRKNLNRDCDDTEVGLVSGFNPAVAQSPNEDSTFIAVPLSASDTCETLIANEGTLFR
jgi:hypothetical protein